MPKNAKAKREARARKERTGESYATARAHTSHTPTTSRSKGVPWSCVTCGQPISGGEGIVELINTNAELGPIGAYPRAPSDDKDLMAAPNVKAIVYHQGECDPYPDAGDGYWFTTDRAATLEAWCSWVDHVFEKTWMSRDDMQRFLGFWFRNRGRDIHKHGA